MPERFNRRRFLMKLGAFGSASALALIPKTVYGAAEFCPADKVIGKNRKLVIRPQATDPLTTNHPDEVGKVRITINAPRMGQPAISLERNIQGDIAQIDTQGRNTVSVSGPQVFISADGTASLDELNPLDSFTVIATGPNGEILDITPPFTPQASCKPK